MLLYYIDFFLNWFFLNLVSATIYFVAYPLTYADEGPKNRIVLEKAAFVLWLNVFIIVMELLGVYIEKIAKNYED